MKKGEREGGGVPVLYIDGCAYIVVIVIFILLL